MCVYCVCVGVLQAQHQRLLLKSMKQPNAKGAQRVQSSWGKTQQTPIQSSLPWDKKLFSPWATYQKESLSKSPWDQIKGISHSTRDAEQEGLLLPPVVLALEEPGKPPAGGSPQATTGRCLGVHGGRRRALLSQTVDSSGVCFESGAVSGGPGVREAGNVPVHGGSQEGLLRWHTCWQPAPSLLGSWEAGWGQPSQDSQLDEDAQIPRDRHTHKHVPVSGQMDTMQG